MKKTCELANLTWPEAERLYPEISLGVMLVAAICKAHGPHLPLNTDYVIGDALLRSLGDEINFLRLPDIPFGHYPGFVRYTGSTSISEKVNRSLLSELLQVYSGQGLKSFFIFNMGYTTESAVANAKSDIESQCSVRVHILNVREIEFPQDVAQMVKKGGSHAGEVETALMLYLKPGLIDMERIPSMTQDADEYRIKFGIIGDPREATAELGAKLFQIYREALASAILRASEPINRR